MADEQSAFSDRAQRSTGRHCVGDLFRSEIELGTVSRGTPVVDALQLMLDRHFSQLLVVEESEYCGMVSLWDVARALVASPELRLVDLDVEDVMDPGVPRVTVDHGLDDVVHLLTAHEALPVVSPRGPQAVLTHTDVLIYLYRIARRFFVIEEIEHALRGLIEVCVPGQDLPDCAKRTLAHKYEPKPPPTELTAMTFHDYVNLIDNEDNHENYFRTALGRLRKVVRSRLTSMGNLRNVIFHFKREITRGELDRLRTDRDWLLDKEKRARRRREEGCS